MPPPMEPTLAAFPNPFLRYFAATRPPFLSVTFAACLVGLATAALDGAMLRPAAAFFTVFFALVAHAGINVLNDYNDALNGSDAATPTASSPSPAAAASSRTACSACAPPASSATPCSPR